MEIKELQKKADEIVGKLDKKFNCEHNVNHTFMHLIEELGEMSKELNRPNIRNGEINKEELGDEISDVLLLICRIANLNEIDLEESFNRKVGKLNRRHGCILK